MQQWPIVVDCFPAVHVRNPEIESSEWGQTGQPTKFDEQNITNENSANIKSIQMSPSSDYPKRPTLRPKQSAPQEKYPFKLSVKPFGQKIFCVSQNERKSQ